MSDLNSLYIKTETLETLTNALKKKGEKGIELTISRNNTPNQYGQNVSAFVSQSKEERDENKPKYYIGNGKTFWTDGTNIEPIKSEEPKKNEPTNDDLPDFLK